MTLYPLFADLHDREVLVVGGGEVATRKVEALLRAGACVCVCAPALTPALEALRSQRRLEHRPQALDPGWLDTVWLVIVATDDPAFNARIAAEANQRRKLANIVDDAALSTFQVPAIVDRSPLVVAISSAGAAPMLARRLREQLETQLDHTWGALATLFLRHRGTIRKRFPDLAERRRWYDAVVDGSIPALLRNGDREAAERALLAALDAPVNGEGSTTLIAIEGDTEELTLRALRVMNQADVLFADEEVGADLLDLARRDAPRERFTHVDDALIGRIASQSGHGRRVVVLLSDAAIAAAAARTLGLGEANGCGVFQLFTTSSAQHHRTHVSALDGCSA